MTPEYTAKDGKNMTIGKNQLCGAMINGTQLINPSFLLMNMIPRE